MGTVESFADPKSKFSIMSTCRYHAVTGSLFNQPNLELYRHWGWVNYLHTSMPVGARWIPFFRVLQDGVREMFDLFPGWDDDEQCFSAKVGPCSRYFRSIGWEETPLGVEFDGKGDVEQKQAKIIPTKR